MLTLAAQIPSPASDSALPSGTAGGQQNSQGLGDLETAKEEDEYPASNYLLSASESANMVRLDAHLSAES